MWSIEFELRLGFAAKMRKFSFAFRKLFREISHFIAKMNDAKKAKQNENHRLSFAFIFKIPSFFVKFSHFFANFITSHFAKISYFSRNILKRNFAKKRKISRKLFLRGKCEIFAKQFFLFAENPSLEWESMSSVKLHGVLSSECELIWSVKFKVWSYVKCWV